MKISPQTLADLALLTQAADAPEVDLLEIVARFVADVTSAVPSYLGMSLSMGTPDSRVDFTVMADQTQLSDIRSSLLIPALAMIPGDADRDEQHGAGLVLYAGVPGALVDLAADLGWLSDLPLQGFVLDAHLTPPAPGASSLSATTHANQALGVLLGRGFTPEQAQAQITARASTAGISREAVVEAILAEVSSAEHRPASGTP